MTVIRIKPPDRKEKGFLRRQREYLELMERLNEEQSLAAFDAFIEWILPRIVEPEDRNEARELLLDASQDEIETIGKGSIGIETGNPTTPAQES